MDCIFCKIVGKQIPCKLVDESESTLAFLDIAPLNKGHTLVIPKKHYADLHEIPYEDLAGLVRKVKQLAGAMKQSLGCDGVNVFQNNGSAAGQLVFHIHFHVVPRFKGDHLDMSNWRRVKYDSEQEKLDTIKKIRKAL